MVKTCTGMDDWCCKYKGELKRCLHFPCWGPSPPLQPHTPDLENSAVNIIFFLINLIKVSSSSQKCHFKKKMKSSKRTTLTPQGWKWAPRRRSMGTNKVTNISWSCTKPRRRLIASESYSVKSIIKAYTGAYATNLLWQPHCHWLLKSQSIIQRHTAGTAHCMHAFIHSLPRVFKQRMTSCDSW